MKPIVKQLIKQTQAELSAPIKPKAKSRVWKSANGYIYLIPWANASLLRLLLVKYIKFLRSSNILQYPLMNRLEAQILDAARSTIANMEEGYARPTTSEYLQFLGYSQASLKEVKGDVQRFIQDGHIKSKPGSKLSSIGIDLKFWHEELKKSVISSPPKSSKVLQSSPKESRGNYRKLEEFTESRGNYRKLEEFTESRKLGGVARPGLSVSSPPKSSKILQNPLRSSTGIYRNLEEITGSDPEGSSSSSKILYSPLNSFNPSDLTYEILIELINKTDWHLRRLVESLENKLEKGRMGYKVLQARIKSNLK